MADEHGPVGSKRSFWFIFFVGLFTLGIYWIYWFYKTNMEIKEYGKLNSSPILRLVGMIFLSWLWIPGMYIMYLWLKDITETAKKEGLSGPSPLLNAVLSFIIPFWAIYAAYSAQATLNHIWEAASKKPAAAPAAAPAKAAATVESSESPTEKVLLVCPRCKARNTEESNYCKKCGEKLIA